MSTRIASLLVTIAPRTEIAEPSTSDLFAHEWAKFRRRPVLTWCLVIIAVVAIGFTVGRAAIILGRDRWDNDFVVTADTWDFLALPNLIETASLILSMIGSLLTVVLGAAVVTSDYQWGTMRVLVGTGADRIRIMLGKLGTLVLCVLLIMAVGMVLTLAGGFATRYALGKEPSVDWSFNSDFFIDLLRILGIVLLSLLLGTAISFALGVLSRSQALAIAGTLIFFSLEGVVTALLGFLGGIGDVIAQVLLDKNQARLNEYMQFNPNVGSGINPWQALAVTIAWIVVPVLIALWVFRKQEITSGA